MKRFLIAAASTCLLLACVLTSFASATLQIDDWDTDALSEADGIVSIDIDDVASIPATTITNTTTGESVAVAISANTGIMNESGNPGDNMGINGASGSDVADQIDGRGGIAEALTFTFSKPIQVTFLNFGGINWDTNGAAADDYEFVEVSIGGVLTYTLFSDNADTGHAGFTSATGAIAADSSDNFESLAWNIPASTPLEFAFGADAASFSSQAGFQLDDIEFSVVPEASSFFFGGLVAAVAAVGYRRRQAA